MTAVALASIGALAGAGTWSAFNELTSNPGNTFEAGTVTIRDDDGGAAIFGGIPGGLKPGDSFARCIVVSYDGTLPARVRLHGTTGGTGLDPYLMLTVTRGTKTTTGSSSCADFAADSTTYTPGKPAGVIFDGTLAGYPDSSSAAIADPVAGSPETWTNNEQHAYRVEVTVQNDAAAAGKTATQVFRWEAENE